MDRNDKSLWRQVELRDGEQIVINGALVSANGPSTLNVGSGATVVQGRALWTRDRSRLPAGELYYAAMQAAQKPVGFQNARYQLFALLAHVVASSRTIAAQAECARFAAAMLSDLTDEALEAARVLAEAEKQQSKQAWDASEEDTPQWAQRRRGNSDRAAA